MTTYFVPDNTVLVNFARIERMDVLERLVNGKGMWCASVAHECDMSSGLDGLRSIVRAHDIFGEPLYPETGKEHVDTQTIRTSFAKPGESKSKHLGEAETIAIVSNRGLDARFITDDEAATVRARAEGIDTYTTWDLLKLVVMLRWITLDEAWGYVFALNGHTRRYAFLRSESAFRTWCRT